MAAAPRVEALLTADGVEAFCHEWRANVLDYFRARGVPPDDADDLTQTVFVAVLVQWDELPRENREGRLWTIAHRRHVDYVRRNARWADLSLPLTEVADPPCAASDPASVVVRLDTARQVRLAVEHEKPEHQRLLYERYVEERPYDALARVYGTSAGALRNVVSRAHDRLRTRLEAAGLRSLVPAIPGLGCRWTRRTAAPPWAVAVGHGAFVSLVATTMVMAPPSAVPAAAAPVHDVADGSTSHHPAPPRAATRGAGGRDVAKPSEQSRRTSPAGGPSGGSDHGRKHVKVPVPDLSLPPLPEPCVGTCRKPSEQITLHTPVTDVRRGQNVAPVCRHVPGQPVVTCRAEEGTEYAVSPPPRQAEN